LEPKKSNKLITGGNRVNNKEKIEKIAHRKGLGNLLVEGFYQAAIKIGKGAEKFIYQAKGTPNV